MRRKKKNYFKQDEGAPAPLIVQVKRRISFSEVDPMAIAWHGRYPQFFEMASEELARRIGLSYENYFENNLRAPIVQLHTDYHRPIVLDEEITIQAKLVWSEAARLNIEFTIFKEDSTIAATGFTVQMFTEGTTGEPCLVTPNLFADIREQWKNGELTCLIEK